MTIGRGRILRANELGELTPIEPVTQPSLARGRVEPREVVDASERARAIVAAAEEKARVLIEQAALQAGDVRVRAEAEGRAEGIASVAARAIALASREARMEEQSLERATALARVLAERLLGEELRLDPARVVALARQALAEARGARRVRLVAHPDDVVLLERSLPDLGIDPAAIALVPDPQRARGNLRLETDIGVLDAELAPQLDRLAARLERSLKG